MTSLALDWRVITDEALYLLQSLLRIDTTNPPGNELVAARLLAEYLQRQGIESEILESAQGRGNLICRLQGDGSRRPSCSTRTWMWCPPTPRPGGTLPSLERSQRASCGGAAR